MAVYGYARVSTANQLDNTSLSEQRRKIMAIADYHGWTVDEVFEERAVSGGVALHDRPEGFKMVAKLCQGDIVITPKLDRMFRSAVDAMSRAQLWREHGVGLIVADIATDPVTGDGQGKLFFSMLAVLAEFERTRIAERMAEGKNAKARAQGYNGGFVPFGYKVDGNGKEARLVPDPAEFAALGTMMRGKLLGLSTREIRAEVLNRHDMDVAVSTIHRIVRRLNKDPQYAQAIKASEAVGGPMGSLTK